MCFSQKRLSELESSRTIIVLNSSTISATVNALYILAFYISSLTWLSFFLSVHTECICPYTQQSNSPDQKTHQLLFHHFPTSPLVFLLLPSRVLDCCMCVVQDFPQCNSGITIQHRAHTAFCFVLFPRGCAHSSPCTACSAIVTALSPVYS